MNPAFEIGSAKLALDRRPQNSRIIGSEDQATLRATSNRFYAYKLGRTNSSGHRERSFACSDKAAFLERIGASEAQKTYFKGVDLCLVVLELRDGEGRVCKLAARWPLDATSSEHRNSTVMQFNVTNPADSAEYGTLDLTGSVGFCQVDANSSEHSDIVAIADFFPPVQ